MRDCRKLLETLEEKHGEQFNFIKEKASGKDEEECQYFPGIRDDYLCLYYKGHCMAKIEVSASKVTYFTNEYYLSGKNVAHNRMQEMEFKEFKYNFDDIKERIDDHVSGKHDGKERLEKICQQWIMNENNASPESEWYFLDMEYILDNDPLGRADMIAVKRKPDAYGKHEVALIELKIGNNSYKGLNGTQYNKYKEEYKALEEDLYNGSKLKFGSGLVSHITDFMRLLHNTGNYVQIREELFQMIMAHKKLGLINPQNGLYHIEDNEEDIEKLAEKPDIYILSYACVPDLKNAKKTKKTKKTTLSSMKKSFYNYLYLSSHSSKYRLSKMINKDQIDGILDKMQEFHGILEDDKSNIITCRQKIGEEDYRFIFQFIDPDKISPQWKCLE